MKQIGWAASILYLWVGITATAFGQEPVRLRVGSFSVVMPTQARIVNHQSGNGIDATVYAASVRPVTFFLSFLRFSSPQVEVTPEQFAHNTTADAPQAQILGFWHDRLAGYPADKTLYRIGQMTVIAWSVQPDPMHNYILSVNGPDSPQFRDRAEQYARSFSAQGEHAGVKR